MIQVAILTEEQKDLLLGDPLELKGLSKQRIYLIKTYYEKIN